MKGQAIGGDPDDSLKSRAAPTRLGGVLMAMGPGIIVTGSVIGSGELINTPVQAARFGFVLLWAVILSCVIKYFLQVEIGRHALVHNWTPFQAFNQLPGPKWRGISWIGPTYMVGALLTGTSLAGMLRASAGLLHSVVPLTADASWSINVWSVLISLGLFMILWRGTYADLEKTIAILVAVFSLSVLIGLFLIQGTEYRISGRQVVSGLTLSFGKADSSAAAMAVVSLLGALGATANELFMYPYWVLEKGYGSFIGPRDASGWANRARGWIRVLQIDVALCTTLATATTIGYFLIGASVFHGHGSPPGGDQILDQLSAMFTRTWGPWSKLIFLAGAMCTILSTLIVAIAAFSRMWTDLFACLRWVDRAQPRSVLKSTRAVQLAYITACLALAIGGGQPPERLVIFAQYVAGLFCTPVLMTAICLMAFRTNREARMGSLTGAFLIFSVVLISACIVVSLAYQAGWLGGH